MNDPLTPRPHANRLGDFRSSRLPPEIVVDGRRLLAIVGGYGSGKTEVSVNLALGLAAAGATVQIADLDLVNPYFRCREARVLMAAAGIRVVVPPGSQAWADLPIVLPEIGGMLHPPEGTWSLFDVGGDDVGARALSAFRPQIREGEYDLLQVINSRRPFSDSVNACAVMRAAIEGASRLTVTGLIVNSHLCDETDADVVREGWELARDVSKAFDVPIRAVAVLDELADHEDLLPIEAPILRMRRYMVPPWIEAAPLDGAAPTTTARPHDLTPLPAAAPRPIGVPGPLSIDRPTGERHG